jgi:protein phosphatase
MESSDSSELPTPGIHGFGCTDVGMVRESNQDNYLLAEGLSLFVVADGMGGHNGGEVASQIAVETIDDYVRLRKKDGPLSHDGPLEKHPAIELIASALKQASARIHRTAVRSPDLHGMGTTVTGIFFHGRFAFVGHVGDSRAYLIRGNRIEQLSDDHSMVAEMVRAGMMTPEQAEQSHMKNIITRSVGVDEDVAVDTIVVPLQPNDLYLLCSDGLINQVKDEEILMLAEENFVRDLPRKLVEMANSRGGDDNISVVVALIESLPS